MRAVRAQTRAIIDPIFRLLISIASAVLLTDA